MDADETLFERTAQDAIRLAEPMSSLVDESPLVRLHHAALAVDELEAHRHRDGMVRGKQDHPVLDDVLEGVAFDVGQANACDLSARILDRAAGTEPGWPPVP